MLCNMYNSLIELAAQGWWTIREGKGRLLREGRGGACVTLGVTCTYSVSRGRRLSIC